jgi:hypothetical protein
MKRARGGFGIVGLFVFLAIIVAFLPMIRRTFARSFPEGFRSSMEKKEGFRNVDCKGMICKEGEFCQENVCRPVMPAITNSY